MLTTPARSVIEIRPATAEDVDRLVDMAVRFLASTRYGVLVTPHPHALGRLIAQVLAIGVIFVAEVNGRVEAMLALVALPHPISGELYGDELAWWVEPEHRHGSIGPRLLLQAETWARERGARILKMVAPADSTVGNFYKHFGYVEVETAYQKTLREGA